MSGYVEDPAFVRKGSYWNAAPSDLLLPEHHHSHDRAWLISKLHQIETKQHGAVFEPDNITILGIQRERWAMAYSKAYAGAMERDNNENLARRAANTQLLNRIAEIKKREFLQ